LIIWSLLAVVVEVLLAVAVAVPVVCVAQSMPLVVAVLFLRN
jgi:hypothetical protein